MKFECLASSSAGNCYYIEMQRRNSLPAKLMLEVGLSYKEINKKALVQGINMAEIDAVLITHQHGDHCKSTKDFIERRIPVYANNEVLDKYGGKVENTLRHGEKRYIERDTMVIPISLEHDAPNTLGFIICTDMESMLFINDCKFFKADLSEFKFDYICFETNYDGQMLHYAYEDAKKNNDYQNITRYERLFNSHMSLSHARDILKKMDLSNCKAIFLMHLSDRHANENKFKAEIQNATGINTYVCKKNGGIL